MITPYVDSWPQAMAISALPTNMEEHFKNLTKLMDDIWYYAGDRSTDVSSYKKLNIVKQVNFVARFFAQMKNHCQLNGNLISRKLKTYRHCKCKIYNFTAI